MQTFYRSNRVSSNGPVSAQNHLSASGSHFPVLSQFTSGEQTKDHTNENLRAFTRIYERFAQSVLSQVAREDPQQTQTAKLLFKTGRSELDKILSSLRVRTAPEETKIKALVLGIATYMEAAVDLDDRVAMLSYAVDEFRTVLEELGLVRLTSQQSSWYAWIPASSPQELTKEMSSHMRAPYSSAGEGQSLPQGPEDGPMHHMQERQAA